MQVPKLATPVVTRAIDAGKILAYAGRRFLADGDLRTAAALS